ncbi:MAG TPA: thiol:disulfide interchange protein DsbG [Alphaproteobacteria bacterium]|jgi:thiol:disulfide interchange protein DsbG|nr:thiol:disulfide interchange protein DsbG [Micavibrio sp.]MBK9562302.1 thiol:disulfide interchange protein DsbG [Micavibrio sp.]HQX27885.1 thiol:disulfide interchange protein DsbG [Alphaproteobacteria bacterium]
MKKLFLVMALAAFSFSAYAADNDPVTNTTLPDMPKPIQELVNQGAQVRYIGKDHGLDAWITVKNGQEQYFYVLPDKSAFVMGLLFDANGKLVTVQQVKRLQEQGDTLLDTLAEDANAAKIDPGSDPKFKSPSEQMYYDIENSNWVPLGQQGAPVAYAFIDPQCPHCHEFIQSLRAEYIDKGKIQLRIIPVGFKDETRAQAAFLLATPNPAERWFKHMDGDTSALPAKTELNDQGVQRNLATMQSWQFSVTPMIVYRGKDNSVKLVRGNPKDLAAFVNDLGARS